MTPVNDVAGNDERALLRELASAISADKLALLRAEAGFQHPNEFNFDLLLGPLSTLAFPAESECYEIMWAIFECEFSALEGYPAPLRQYLAALYLHCNRIKAWGMNVEADFHHMLVAATLDARSAASPVMAFLERLAEPTGAVEGFDPRMAHFSWLLLHSAVGLPETDVSQRKRELLATPMAADLRADLLVAKRSAGDWERLFTRARGIGNDLGSCNDFAGTFWGSRVLPPSR